MGTGFSRGFSRPSLRSSADRIGAIKLAPSTSSHWFRVRGIVWKMARIQVFSDARKAIPPETITAPISFLLLKKGTPNRLWVSDLHSNTWKSWATIKVIRAPVRAASTPPYSR